MSLLLDARKKSRQARSDGDGNHSGKGLSLEPYPASTAPAADLPPASSADSSSTDKARVAGQNLFNAKSTDAAARPRINRNVLAALGVTVLLLAAGAGYVWYAITPGSPSPVRRDMPQALALASTHEESRPSPAAPQNNLVPEIASSTAHSSRITHAKKLPARAASPREPHKTQLHIEPHQDEPIDPLLNHAYLAYRNGKFDEAQQLYREVLDLDSSNTDALLGMAVIAQRRGMDDLAAHYYAQVMALDPRNAVANAGMSALTTDDNRESRLKTLLNEQQDSPSLHFALGNYYAQQGRWSEAQQSYFNAYKLEPANAELAFNLASSLDHLGQKQAAAQYYQRALQLDPGNHAGFDHAKISQRIEELAH